MPGTERDARCPGKIEARCEDRRACRHQGWLDTKAEIYATVFARCYLDCVPHQVIEHSEVGVPPIQVGRRLAEPHGLGRRMTGELFADTAAGDNDAGLSVSAQEHAQSARVEVDARVSPAGQWMPDDDDLEFTALEDVGGVDDDLVDGSPLRRYVSGSPFDVVSLVAVSDADRDVAGPKARTPCSSSMVMSAARSSLTTSTTSRSSRGRSAACTGHRARIGPPVLASRCSPRLLPGPRRNGVTPPLASLCGSCRR